MALAEERRGMNAYDGLNADNIHQVFLTTTTELIHGRGGNPHRILIARSQVCTPRFCCQMKRSINGQSLS
ncbi:MAG: hypothetical protein ACI9VI_001070 [Candidatus Azotimanducaceae bacterium]|jgi:hypothetical protein